MARDKRNRAEAEGEVEVCRMLAGSVHDVCLEDPDNDYAQITFDGKALKLIFFGYPKYGRWLRTLDGNKNEPQPTTAFPLTPVNSAGQPLPGLTTIASYSTANGKWDYVEHEINVNADPDATMDDYTVVNYVIWWHYEAGDPLQFHTVTELVQVKVPAKKYLQPC